MSIDDKIKKDLAEQAQELDQMMQEKEGLGDYLKTGFRSGMKWVMVIGYIYAIVFTVLMFTFGYQFFNAEPERQIFWGVLLVLVFNALIAVKLWIFIETNRNHTSKEIRRLELRLRGSN